MKRTIDVAKVLYDGVDLADVGRGREDGVRLLAHEGMFFIETFAGGEKQMAGLTAAEFHIIAARAASHTHCDIPPYVQLDHALSEAASVRAENGSLVRENVSLVKRNDELVQRGIAERAALRSEVTRLRGLLRNVADTTRKALNDADAC